MCALLIFFAVAAKVSPYAPQHKDMKVLSTNKVWQDDAGRAFPAPPEYQAIVVATLALLFLASAFHSSRPVSFDEPRLTRFEWFSPDLSVRPPPSA